MSFIRLSREPGFHYLAGHMFMQASANYDHMIEAQCIIQSLTKSGISFAPLAVPLSDFAAYPIGSTFGQERVLVNCSPARRRSNRRVQLGEDAELWHADRSIEIRPRHSSHRFTLPLAPEHTVVLSREGDGPRLGLPHAEQFRFFCASVSLLLDTLSMISLAPTSPIESMFVNRAESGIDENGTLVITPFRPYQNVTATLQIALLLSEPAIIEFVRARFLDISLALARGREALPGRTPFPEACDYTIESERLIVGLKDGSREDVEFCDRIVADHRLPKFKEIVVRVRSSRADEQIERVNALLEAQDGQVSRFTSSTKITRYPRSSTRTIRLARLQSEFGRLFPAFGSLKVRFDREYVSTASPGSSRPRKLQPGEISIPLASVGPPGGPVDRPRVLTVPTDTVLFERPTLSERFLADSAEPGLTPVIAQLEHLPPLQRGFLEAGYYLYDNTAHDLLPHVELSRGEELLFELPDAWGGFAARGPAGHSRLIAAIPIRLDHGIVWAIEVFRRPREQFAMGLCAQIEQDDGLNFLGRVMRSICNRVGRKRGDDPYGTWPRANFLDLRIDSVRHSETRWEGETLAQVLLSRAHLLLAPDRTI